jgi:hypothetical protein
VKKERKNDANIGRHLSAAHLLRGQRPPRGPASTATDSNGGKGGGKVKKTWFLLYKMLIFN